MSHKYDTVNTSPRRRAGDEISRRRPRGRRWCRGGALLLPVAFLALTALRDDPAIAATPPAWRAAHAAVASDHPSASQAGLSRLRAGGNAVDAACATALALGVVHPFASGMGGGGFAIIYIAREHKAYALDFRERAPAAVRPEMYLRNGKADPLLSTQGGLAAGVPGEVRGLGEMVRRWGKLPFSKCVEPAERLARSGFPVSWRLADALKTIPRQPAPADPVFAQVFATNTPMENEIARRPDLAWTLGKLRAGGPEVFYHGEIADEIIRAVRAGGGVMTADDLKSYALVERPPLATTYRGLRVISMPPPSSGGTVLVETLGILSARFPDDAALVKLGRNSSGYLHVLAEAFKHGFADRARFLGDPDFVTVDLEHLTDPAYHRSLAARIKDDGVLPRDQYGTPEAQAPPALHRDGGTTHLAVIDADGNAVSLTTTVNLGFGAHLVAGKTGVLLNNQMDDFSVQPGVPNAFGLIGSAQNAVAPGKRPLSSMTPTVVLDGDRVKMVVGAAGGPTIITATTQVLLNVVDWKLDAQAAVAAPRIHDQWFPDLVLVESDIPRDVVEGLARRGQKSKELSKIGVANVIVRTNQGLEAGAEPRSPSAPAGN
jgi:gamma-glutamyltranspeptidase/glutathione hydrolase